MTLNCFPLGLITRFESWIYLWSMKCSCCSCWMQWESLWTLFSVSPLSSVSCLFMLPMVFMLMLCCQDLSQGYFEKQMLLSVRLWSQKEKTASCRLSSSSSSSPSSVAAGDGDPVVWDRATKSTDTDDCLHESSSVYVERFFYFFI